MTIFFFKQPVSQEELRNELLKKIEQASIPDEYGLEYKASYGRRTINYEEHSYSIKDGEINFFSSTSTKQGTGGYNFVCNQTVSPERTLCTCQNRLDQSIESCGEREIDLDKVLTIKDLKERMVQNIDMWENPTKNEDEIKETKERYNFNLIENKGKCYLAEEIHTYFREVCFDEDRIIRYIEYNENVFENNYSVWFEVFLE
jgi:hypothetical protein|tara:strand:- start:3930 stop:4535 length:606 start_codon:yes stop_codon:yes gene_type:complete